MAAIAVVPTGFRRRHARFRTRFARVAVTEGQLDLITIDQLRLDRVARPIDAINPNQVRAAWPSSRPFSPVAAAVAEFHLAFELPRARAPRIEVPAELAQLRIDLLVEEVEEFRVAVADRNLIAVADALADILYVTYGAAITYGIDVDAVVGEVHRSNMSKLDTNGLPVLRADGKVLKSDRYHPPDIARVLADQPLLPF
jgi:predicted HAD superfamily Cof-like phosphohydrolase